MRSVPLRPYHEFLGKNSRFSLPTDSSWRSRLQGNLIYYQSNYFLLSLCVFLLLSLSNPSAVLVGLFFLLVPLVLSMMVDVSPTQARDPKIILPIVFTGGAALIYFINDVLQFVAMILLPTLVILLHALLRQRNIKAKVTKLIESARTSEQKTLMSYILEFVGCNVSAIESEL